MRAQLCRARSDPTSEFPTLDLTYERYSADVTRGERVHFDAAIERLVLSACEGGGCYDAMSVQNAESLEDFAGNSSLFRDTAWYNDAGISLLGAMLRLYLSGVLAPGVRSGLVRDDRHAFFTSMLYFDGQGTTPAEPQAEQTSTSCTIADECTVHDQVTGYRIDSSSPNATACTPVTTLATYHDCCALASGNSYYFWGWDSAATTCSLCPEEAWAAVIPGVAADAVGVLPLTAYTTTPSATTQTECETACADTSVGAYNLPGFPIRGCTCYTWDSGGTCTLSFGPTASTENGPATSTSRLARWRPPVASSISINGYDRRRRGCGVCRQYPAAQSPRTLPRKVPADTSRERAAGTTLRLGWPRGSPPYPETPITGTLERRLTTLCGTGQPARFPPTRASV